MSKNNLTLTVAQEHWRLFMRRKADKAFPTFADKIFQRDQYQCQFCGFRAEEHLDLINVDGNYRNNKAHNLMTACPLCAQCFFIDSVGQGDFGGGTLIYFPEISQAQLNALCHFFLYNISAGNQLSSQSKDHYRRLKARSDIVEKRLGQGLSQPSTYGQMLIDSSKDVTGLHKDVCAAVRLLPNLRSFAPMALAWAQASIDVLASV